MIRSFQREIQSRHGRVRWRCGFRASRTCGRRADHAKALVNAALRLIWDQSAGRVDTIVCGGTQKRRINQFIAAATRTYDPSDQHMGELVNVYESDFGVCRVVLSRWIPADTILFLDSSRIEVPPLTGRSFQFRPLGPAGDSSLGQVLGEYTLEFRNENAHGLIRGLNAA